MSERQNGKVKFYNSSKGFGFITRDKGADLFFHATDLVGTKTIADGASVTFSTEQGKKGEKACEVKAA